MAERASRSRTASVIWPVGTITPQPSRAISGTFNAITSSPAGRTDRR